MFLKRRLSRQFWIWACAVGAVLLSACAPMLVGSPSDSGIVMLQADLNPTDQAAWYSASSGSLVSFGTSLSQSVGGRRFKDYVIFSGLKPGNYVVRNVAWSRQIGNQIITTTLAMSREIIQKYPGLIVKVENGKPAFIGRLRVVQTPEQFEFQSSPEFELQAWKAFVADPAYSRHAWTPVVREHIRQLQDAIAKKS